MARRKFAPRSKLIRRKRWARKPKRVLVNRALHPIPQRFITKLKYSESITLNGTGQYAMNLNSIYDPNRTGTGHQPYGYDQLAVLYNRYRVVSCGYRIQSGTTTGNIAFAITALPANQEITTSSGSEVRENPRAKYVVQQPGGATATLSGKTYIPSLMGRNKAQYMADDNYQAQVNASPSELAILNLQCFSMNTDLAIPGAVVNVVMEFTVEFFDIKSLGQS